MGNTSSTNDAIDKALNPDRNGLSDSVKKTNNDIAVSIAKTTDDVNKSNAAIADSVKKTTNDINVSNAKIKTQIDNSNAQIGQQLQTNLAATKSKLDNSLEQTKNQLDLNLALTRQTINYGQLQKATGVLSQLASITPIGYLGLEGINVATGGDSNKYLNNSDNTGNPLLNTLGGLFNAVTGGVTNPFDSTTKQLEQPTVKDSATSQYTSDTSAYSSYDPNTTYQPYDPNASYSKYSQFNDTSTTQKNKNDNTDLFVGAAVAGGVIVLLVAAKKMST